MKENSLKPVIEKLEDLFSKFNEKFYNNELDKPIITVSPDTTKGAYGWCTAWKAWSTQEKVTDFSKMKPEDIEAMKKEGFYEINICAEYLSRPFDKVAETLLHEMVHLYNLQVGVQDTSRGGTYHNKKYKEAAEKHGLTVEKDAKYGWTKTSLNEEVKAVDADVEGYLKLLQDMLINHTYHTSEYEKFIKRENGKEREIFKLPYFPDRICQWAILQVIEPYLIRNFTKNTYSAIPDRGIHSALHDVQEAMQKDVPNCQFCLKLDIRHYYPSINHEILKTKFRRLFKDAELLWLLDEIIDSICTANIEDLRNIWLLDEDYDPETGIPIGNFYLSQYCGNFYLSSFDHWIKEEKRVKHYFRYMDDIVIFGNSKEELHRLEKEIEEYFRRELRVVIKGNYQVLCVSDSNVKEVFQRVEFCSKGGL